MRLPALKVTARTRPLRPGKPCGMGSPCPSGGPDTEFQGCDRAPFLSDTGPVVRDAAAQRELWGLSGVGTDPATKRSDD